ncbi:TM2 domain-containing protein [Psychroflexus aurantiacus]|uniref:TM2 domain-containing protein n=1 Tax=Psychroflexus aurantiacus TaxID=2709310 RepID=UPI001967102A|nr:TM2 domain-containing protein [Psychroflexus aurantiacus]
MKDKTAAGLLAFFIGSIGIHRFYLNQVGLGFLYLLFSWTLIPLLVSFYRFYCVSGDG